MREKVVRNLEREVVYTKEHWEILRGKRRKASAILELLYRNGVIGYVYGSVARGDVNVRSDIDVVILTPIKTFIVEQLIELNIGTIYAREIVQATPKNTPKALIYIDNETTISIPIVSLKKTEYEFYKYGGMIGYPDIKDIKNRVPGVDKRLVMILPTRKGHREVSIIGRESWAAKILGVSIDTVMERVKVLTKRDAVGRTGVFLKRQLSPDESFDTVFKKLVDTNPALRRMLKKRGYM